MKIEEQIYNQKLEQKKTIHQTEESMLNGLRLLEAEVIARAEEIAKSKSMNMVLYSDYNRAMAGLKLRTLDYLSYTLKYKLSFRK